MEKRTSLGLGNMDRIAKMFHGTFEMESILGEETTVAVTIPRGTTS